MKAMSRRAFVSTTLAAGALVLPRRSNSLFSADRSAEFPIVDYHVHLSNQLSIEKAVALSKSRNIPFGIVDHPGANTGGFRTILTDDHLQAYINDMRKYPVFVGLQPVYPGWSKPFKESTINQVDYILMDALTMPAENGGWMYLWAADTFIDDEEAFMERYFDFIQTLLKTERIDIFAWPTYLPSGIAREYHRLWTPSRVQTLIELVKTKGAAVEINEVARVPDISFIRLAREAGLKFTFGTDARNDNAGRFSYGHKMIEAAGLTPDDLFTIQRKSS